MSQYSVVFNKVYVGVGTKGFTPHLLGYEEDIEMLRPFRNADVFRGVLTFDYTLVRLRVSEFCI